jgi:hypothetical protein
MPTNPKPKYRPGPSKPKAKASLPKPSNEPAYKPDHRDLKVFKLDKVLSQSAPVSVDVMPGIIYEGQLALIRVAADVDAQLYAASIGMAVSAGIKFSPFGQASQGNVLFAFGGPNAARVMEQCRLLLERFKNDANRNNARANFHLYHFDLGDNDEGSLIETAGLEMFEAAIPEDCKLIIFYHSARCLRKRLCDSDAAKQFGVVLKDLNRRGIATLVFVHAGSKGAAHIEQELLAETNGYTLEFTKDPGAPTEFGTGFNVMRRKTSEHDTVPTYFQVWHTVIDQKLTTGWECRDPHNKATAKQLEIAEREKRVARLISQGMQQKDIAAEMGLTPATVSRAASAVKAKAIQTELGHTDSSPPAAQKQI